jgi:histidinol-phosphatase (PHP family)
MELIQTRKYHILAHLDLPKKYGFKPKNKNRYYQKIEEILIEVKNQEMSVEISTGGLRKVIGELYPDDKIIQMMIQNDIPLVTSSDSHKPEEVGYNFPQLYSHLKKLGVTHLYKYTNGQKSPVEID